ncbi:DUF6538 domain-containing protein [Gluconobacter kondonii]|uniref:DUF6538 domain-containing protein n=1 Tax=Gluconobacter kondonii TaxID=941463 RepID=UPI001B8C17E2|nr:tyrosine-type recombinase/integrase [Gluconobacter kondonii]
MLRIRGTTYHFRRIVPPALRSVLNQREIWVSLKTGYQNEARKRAFLLHARTTELFEETSQALAGGQERQAVPHVRDALRDLHRLLEAPIGIEEIPLPVSRPKPRPQNMRKASAVITVSNPKPQPLLLSQALTRFVLENPHTSADTRKATQRAVELFLKAYGDAPVPIIGGEKAGAFRDLLFSMPASLGKRKSSLTLAEEADRAKKAGRPTLSGKSVKNHMMRLSALWNQLLQRELVKKNPWTGWSFENGSKTIRRGWSNQELHALMTGDWPRSSVPESTFHLITMIGAYSGMRLGEICHLRTEDLQTIDGIPCFVIQPHTDSGWSPKTDAGTRIVPVHSKLIEAGLLTLKDTPDSLYLIPGLNTSKDGVRGTIFGRSFSTMKTRLGLPAEITFHSFRHSVSTQLRNASADIREIWIDRLLGHEATHKSQGTSTYLSGITTANLKQTVEAISYPDDIFRKGWS